MRASGWLLAGSTIFAGALLLFAVEPLIAKAILPWFGGSAQVWTTCLLFFQTALLAGYLYAHILSHYVPDKWQPAAHTALLILSLTFLPIAPSDSWKPSGSEPPLLWIVGVLTTTIGLPFFLLSATNPLVQSWLARSQNKAPYQLFALSNFGSMLALLSYPLLVEPMLPLKAQIVGWSGAYVMFVLLCALSAFVMRPTAALIVPAQGSGTEPSWDERALWIGLAAAPSGLLLALTNHMLQNIAPIPLFWVIPLAIYLSTFIVAFGSLRWYWRPFWYPLFALAIALLIATLSGYYVPSATLGIPFFCLILLVCCLVCHAELASLRPSPGHLTSYYLLISAGGASGGLFVAILAPLLFRTVLELPILIILTAALVLVVAWRPHRRGAKPVALGTFVLASLSLCAGGLVIGDALGRTPSITIGRNFYGALRVAQTYSDEAQTEGSIRRILFYGTIDHGEQYTAEHRRRESLTYFTAASGVAALFEALKDAPPLKIGVIGLGVGTLAAYCRSQDQIRFYEINPLVVEIAERDFWYLSECEHDIVLGDARLSLERESDQGFDVLVLDAFLGDALPMHLLTREAMAMYRRHLKPGGILLLHVTNRYLDLSPVIAGAAAELGADSYLIRNDADFSTVQYPATWMIVGPSGFFDRPSFKRAEKIIPKDGLRPWTDDYSDLWSVFRPKR